MEDNLRPFGETPEQRIAAAIDALKKGHGILLVDDADRENEGDLIFSAEKMRHDDMALMIRYCSGIVCLCLTQEKADALELPYMVRDNSSLFQTPFTISIDARLGATTGLSAADRIATIQAAIADTAKPTDLVRPGHIFPLRAHPDGVLARNGHTEGSVDLMKLAGLQPTSVLCELMNDDGTMARLPEVIAFATAHNMPVLSIADIVAYRSSIAGIENKPQVMDVV
ncbi:3,4-dihydroxy-2-butanone-4-phosphate synthase [Sphingobacterium psychroaquaticum]|uniref:3,4-dihydroxy-2-butanone 4-phosphate synthase n=1 Tax=Sphingobacterium psychroaquaticum TaxID=561061 RepID=A0A1X7IAU2_9SPHI|nr:3,4-dihydroxy-2-butanone-4-phosphate synthase [Sphingobacterium psychroaquaticum]SMG11820.1 3,4-dihydroxy 2-butanone 4-phosphate synthase [Sphingobacterium psychroaquaticum]